MKVTNIKSYTTDEGSFELVLTVEKADRKAAESTVAKLKKKKADKPDMLFTAEVKPFRKSRSRNANAYLWVLCEKMAIALNSSKEAVYRDMLEQYGVFDTVSIRADLADGFVRRQKYATEIGRGIVGDKEFAHIRVIAGSSEYDTAEMARLLDGVINECQDLGIETATPDEVAQMKELWGKEL